MERRDRGGGILLDRKCHFVIIRVFLSRPQKSPQSLKPYPRKNIYDHQKISLLRVHRNSCRDFLPSELFAQSVMKRLAFPV
jgi:hypothetical protein